MKTTVTELVSSLEEKTASRDRPFWLGIAGAPGSGKSTLAKEIVSRCSRTAIVIPMDGYHFYRSQLDAMSDPEEAHRRRGAPFTFDANRFVAEITAARASGSGTFPSFDHGIGDPVEGDIDLVEDTQLVVVEGNYLLLNESPWDRLRRVFDESWFLQVNIDLCLERVKARQIEDGMDEERNGGPARERKRPAQRGIDRVVPRARRQDGDPVSRKRVKPASNFP